MKNTLLAVCFSALVLSTVANAGVNGNYQVKGTETQNGEKYTFTGTVTVSNYKSGTYALKFSDGERVNYKFNFTKPLKETIASQTVNAFNSQGTSTATLFQNGAKPSIKFTYKSKNGSVRGSGSGSK